MHHVPPSLLAALNADPGEAGSCSGRSSASSTSTAIELRLPDRTFDGRLELEVGGRGSSSSRSARLTPPATRSSFVPDAGHVYTGDILFVGGTPIVWAGPLSNWITACDLILGMDVETVVPGHGPITDKSGVTAVRDYLVFVESGGGARHAAGMDAFDAARDIARDRSAQRATSRRWASSGGSR
jgi:cyclase